MIICETPSRFGGPSDASGYALQKSNLIELPNYAGRDTERQLVENRIRVCDLHGHRY